MDTATASQTPETLDALQVARGRVPIEEFRLLDDCEICRFFERMPATFDLNAELRGHILTDHADLVIVSSS